MSHRPSPPLATRISGWTSNLVATGIVLVAALGLGRQLVRWWGVEGSDAPLGPATPQSSALDEQIAAIDLGAADVARTGFRGDRPAALAQLRSICRGHCLAERPPLASPRASEAAFLERVASRPPIEAEGDWQLQQFDAAMPIVVAVAVVPGPAGEPPATQESAGGPPAQRLANSNRRVVAWGLAAPQGDNAWSLYVYRAGDRGSASDEGFDLPLPAGSRRTLAFGSATERTIGFSGLEDGEAWRRHFDALAAEREWKGEGWQAAAGVWHARYIMPAAAVVDVQFSSGGDGRLVGLIVASHAPSERKQAVP